ncbi:hypothetical protein DFAR_2500023 [Desulfarculales bacterium]
MSLSFACSTRLLDPVLTHEEGYQYARQVNWFRLPLRGLLALLLILSYLPALAVNAERHPNQRRGLLSQVQGAPPGQQP